MFDRESWPAEAMRRAVERLKSAAEGERHDELVGAAARVADYVAAGVLNREAVEAELMVAAASVGLDGKREKEAARCVAFGLSKGSAEAAWYPNNGMNGEPAPRRFRWLGGKVIELRGLARSLRTGPPESVPVVPSVPMLRDDTRVTWFDGVKATKGDHELLTWDQLAAVLDDPLGIPEAGKSSLPLWTFAEFVDDSRAAGSTVLAVHALVLDYDDEPSFSLDKVHEWWGTIAYLAHTTSSHRVEKTGHPAIPRGRVILPLSRAVDEGEHERLVRWVDRAGRGKIEVDELKNPRRTFFVPSRAPGGYENRSSLDAPVLDVDALLDLPDATEDEDHDGGGGSVYAMTPDGRPFLVKIPGAPVWFVASSDGGYVLRDEKLLGRELNRHWPALPTVFGDPPKKMPSDELFARYGVAGDAVIYTYTGDTRFDPSGPHSGELYVRVGLSAPPPAIRDEDVWDWLELAFNPRVFDWLSVLGRLDRPTAALLLLGPKGIGKSMLAHASARYFGCEVADYDDVFKGRFNDALLRSPIVFLDETTEVETRSGGFRKLVSNSVHAVEGKHRPSATLHGCPRLVISANNPDPLRLGREHLVREDEEAIGARILTCDCNPLAEDWLRTRGGREFTADWLVRPDGTAGRLVETISWIVEHWVAPKGNRFLVEGDAAEWAARASTRAGLPATILDAIRLYLDLDPNQRDPFFVDPPFLWHESRPAEVLVSNAGIRKHWRELLGESERVPSHRAVTDALKRLSGLDGPERLKFTDGQRVQVYPVPETLVPKH